jgi:hypothetical protein
LLKYGVSVGSVEFGTIFEPTNKHRDMTRQPIQFTDRPAVAITSMAKSLLKVIKQYDETAVLRASNSTQSYYIEDCCEYNGVYVSYAIRVSDHAKPGYEVENYIRTEEDFLEVEVYNAEGADLARKAIVDFFNSIK